ncbi:MAG: hypothetical protein V1809_08320 [Planctomycetota bacterium]
MGKPSHSSQILRRIEERDAKGSSKKVMVVGILVTAAAFVLIGIVYWAATRPNKPLLAAKAHIEQAKRYLHADKLDEAEKEAQLVDPLRFNLRKEAESIIASVKERRKELELQKKNTPVVTPPTPATPETPATPPAK